MKSEILEFLIQLSVNNNREWFNANKHKYESAKNAFAEWVDLMINEISKFDSNIKNLSAKDCVYRIYRDVRFSKFKEPYKNHFGALISSGGRKSTLSGYYLHIEPDNSFIGGGIYCPEPHILKSVREQIINNTDEYKQIIYNKNFVAEYGNVLGEKLKTAPKGFDKNNADIELIKNKGYYVLKQLSDEDILSSDINSAVVKSFITLHPFSEFLNKGIIQEL